MAFHVVWQVEKSAQRGIWQDMHVSVSAKLEHHFNQGKHSLTIKVPNLRADGKTTVAIYFDLAKMTQSGDVQRQIRRVLVPATAKVTDPAMC